MIFKVVLNNNFPTYFKTKKAAMAYASEIGGKWYKQVGCVWCEWDSEKKGYFPTK